MRDVSEWEVVSRSTGSREGYWLRDLGASNRRLALVKFPRERSAFTTGEAWAEVLASLVGQALQLPVPDVELVTFRNRFAALGWDFRPPRYELREGSLLAGSLRSIERVALDVVRDRMAIHVSDQEATRRIVQMACFDVLIGNSDRHQENWGVLLPRHAGLQAMVAPFYDNGAAFGSSLGPERLRTLQAGDPTVYDRGFRYEIAVSGDHKPYIDDLLSALQRWDPTLGGLPARLQMFSNARIDELVSAVPPEAISEDQRAFARGLLVRRRDLIAALR